MTVNRTARICVLTLGLISLPLIALPMCAAAEGSGHPQGTAPDKPVAVKRKLKPKPKPAPTTPAEPIPYDAYSGTGAPKRSPDAGHTETPAPVLHTPPAPSIAVVEPPPPPPPVVVEAAPPPHQATGSEISLKCDTRVTRNGKLVSSGTFYVNIFPSPVFPDQLARFQFRFADPNHESLIRESICLDTMCSARVSAAAYALVDMRTKRGKALRITLDRSQGAFYAEQIEGRRHLGEQGWCTVQPLPAAKF